jgi:N-acetylmuramoyl-L-alanine amidase
MRETAPKILLRWLCGLLMLGGGAAAQAVDIQALRVSTTADSTRLMFDVSGPLDYKLFEISNPDRVVLDIRAAGFSAGFAGTSGKGLLKSLRTGKQGKGDARVVLDLAGAAHSKSFLLPPSDKSGYRLIVDLYPKSKSKRDVVKSAAALAAKPRSVVIAIDAGHGGVDPGATGSSGTHEKDITLAVARQLKTLVDKQPGMSAVLTRDSDYFIPLKDRYQKARIAKADLFVSIHADAYAGGDARGSSVWMLSGRGATSEAAHWLADRENRADLVGGVSLDDKDNTLAAVLLDLSQGATMEASGLVADQVLRALGRIGPTHRGYVEKANFVVLRSPDVPSILVETAFITNPAEEKRLNSPTQREKLAAAILEGVRNYFRATPPPGSLFAVNTAKDKPERLAARKAPAETAVFADDDPDRAILARTPKS